MSDEYKYEDVPMINELLSIIRELRREISTLRAENHSLWDQIEELKTKSHTTASSKEQYFIYCADDLRRIMNEARLEVKQVVNSLEEALEGTTCEICGGRHRTQDHDVRMRSMLERLKEAAAHQQIQSVYNEKDKK